MYLNAVVDLIAARKVPVSCVFIPIAAQQEAVWIVVVRRVCGQTPA